MITTSPGFRYRKVIVALAAIAGLIGAACTPPPPVTGDVIVRASQVPGGSANYVDVPVPLVINRSYLHVWPAGIKVQTPNQAYGWDGHDAWTLRCTTPIVWTGPDSYGCEASGGFWQEVARGFSDLPTPVHNYTTVGSAVFTLGSDVNRVSYTGVTTYSSSSRLNIFNTGYDSFVDPSRSGQTWTELLDLEDGDGDHSFAPDQDVVLSDRSTLLRPGVAYESAELQPLRVPVPPRGDGPVQLPPSRDRYRGEVEVNSASISAAVVSATTHVLGSIYELACNGPQTAHPDGTASCPASGRYAGEGAFPSPSGSVDHFDAVGTLRTWIGSSLDTATATFDGTLSYVRTREPDGTDTVKADLPGGMVRPKILHLQDGRVTDDPYPFPD